MDYLHILTSHPLFNRMTSKEIQQILSCFSFQSRHYAKDEYIHLEGDPIQSVGVIVRGTVLMEKDDIYGNNYFFLELREHELFADAFMGNKILKSSVNYKATSDCIILSFHYKEVWNPCTKNCRCHYLFAENLMNMLALKTRSMLAKIEILSKKSLRDRIFTFLSIVRSHPDIIGIDEEKHFQESEHSHQIFVPYNHTEMAEYLDVNRSALVRELKRMKEEGILSYDKNIYTIYMDVDEISEN